MVVREGPQWAERLMAMADVVALIGVSKVTLYHWIKIGDFPAAIRLSERRVAWRESDVMGWIDSRPTPAAHMKREVGTGDFAKPSRPIDGEPAGERGSA